MLSQTVLCGALVLATGAPSRGQQTGAAQAAPAPPVHPATHEQIVEYYQLADLDRTFKKLMGQMLNALRATSAETVPPSVWDQMERDFKNYDLEASIEPAYQKYISQEDLAVTITYLKSDAATRLRASEPYIESLIGDVSKKVGREIGERAARDHMDEIVAFRKQKDAEAAARDHRDASTPQIILPSEQK